MPLAKFKSNTTLSACLQTAAFESPQSFVNEFSKLVAMFERDTKMPDTPGPVCVESPGPSEDNAGEGLDTGKDNTDVTKELHGGLSSDEEESETEIIEKKYLGIREIRIDDLKEPVQDFRVRPINDGRVKEMTRCLLEKNAKSLSSHLTVIETKLKGGQLEYVVVDGNHRLRSMRYIRDHEGKVERFKMVTCRVYRQLTSAQALSLGFNRNREAADVYKMSDYDMVVNLRKICHSLKENNEDTVLTKVYNLLNATTVGQIHHFFTFSGAHCTS